MIASSLPNRDIHELRDLAGVRPEVNLVGLMEGPLTWTSKPRLFQLNEEGRPVELNSHRIALQVKALQEDPFALAGLKGRADADKNISESIVSGRVKLSVGARSPGGLVHQGADILSLAEAVKSNPLGTTHTFATVEAQSMGGRLFICGDDLNTTDETHHMWHAARPIGSVFRSSAYIEDLDERHRETMEAFFSNSRHPEATAIRNRIFLKEGDDRGTIVLKGAQLQEMGLARSFPTVQELAQQFSVLSGWRGNPSLEKGERPSRQDAVEQFWYNAMYDPRTSEGARKLAAKAQRRY